MPARKRVLPRMVFTSTVLMRLNSQQRAWLDAMSNAELRTLSSMLRVLIEEGAHKRGLVPAAPQEQVLAPQQADGVILTSRKART